MKTYEELLEIKKQNEHEFIRELLGNTFSTSVFSFPKQSKGAGIMGKNCISKQYEKPVLGATKMLAIHTNFMISAGSFTKARNDDDFHSLTLTLSKVHITARSAGTQLLIEEANPSILTAAKSIHCGPGNDWDWTDKNVNELLIDINGTLPNLQAALTGFGQAYMSGWSDDLKVAIEKRLRNIRIGVTWA